LFGDGDCWGGVGGWGQGTDGSAGLRARVGRQATSDNRYYVKFQVSMPLSQLAYFLGQQSIMTQRRGGHARRIMGR
jgi:hypothetical protein